MTSEGSKPLIEFSRVTKVYPGPVAALTDVSVTIASGTIHAFVGENGAGKSTLLKILSGAVRPDAGEVRLNDVAVRFGGPREAMDHGIGMVHQEIQLINELRVWQNAVLGIEPTKGVQLDIERARSMVTACSERFSLGVNPDDLVGDLSLAARQKVEICKLLVRSVNVLILDEPTAVLTPQEIPSLFRELRSLADTGLTVCFVSHHLDEVMELSDVVTVLRDGRVVATMPTATTSKTELARIMVDRDVVFTSNRSNTSSSGSSNQPESNQSDSNAVGLGQAGLFVTDLKVEHEGAVGPISFAVASGEVFGIAGVDGSGQREIVEAIIGAIDARGSIRVGGEELIDMTTLERRRYLAFVPAERKTAGGSVSSSLVDNAVMTWHRLGARFLAAQGRVLRRREATEFVEELRASYDIEMHDASQRLGSLSGGNQQKLILGRELSRGCRVIVLDQPTRGLDVGAIEFVHQRILELADDGCAVLIVSAELDELRRLCDRIGVMYRRALVGVVAAAEATNERLGSLMLTGEAV